MTRSNYPRLLRLPEVAKMIGLGRSTIYMYIEKGLFPKPVRISERCVAWPDSEVAAINNAKISGKTNDEIKLLVQELVEQRHSAYKH